MNRSPRMPDGHPSTRLGPACGPVFILAILALFADPASAQQPAPAPAAQPGPAIASPTDAWQALSDGDVAGAEAWALAEEQAAAADTRTGAARLDVACRILSELRFRQARYDDAAAYARKIPNEKARQGALGCSLYMQGKVTEATAALRASLLPPPKETLSAPSSDPAWAAYYLGEALLATGKAAEAKEVLERFVEDMGQTDVRPFFYERKFRELRVAGERALALAARAAGDAEVAKSHLSAYRKLAALPEWQGYATSTQVDEADSLLRGYGINPRSLLPGRPDKDWYVAANVGFAYDTNVLAIADEDLIAGQVTETETGRFEGAFGAGYRIVHTPRVQVWADYSLNATANFDVTEANFQQHLGGIRLMWDFADQWRAGFQVSYEGVRVDEAPFRETFIVRPGVSYRWTDWTLSALEFDFLRSDYFLDVIDQQDRDGETYVGRFTQVVNVPGTDLEARVSVERGQTDSDGSDFDYFWEATRLRLRHPLAWEVVAEAGYTYTHEDYFAKQSIRLFQGFRSDHRHSFFLNLERPINENLTVYVGWTHTTDHSSVDELGYEQDVFAGGVSVRF